MQSLLTSDGSFSPDSAGSACLLRYDDKLFKCNAYLGEHDSVVAELVGGILGLEFYCQLSEVDDSLSWNTDSKVLVEGVNTHYSEWEKTSWHISNGQQLKHVELWISLMNYIRSTKTSVNHIQLQRGRSDLRACDKASRWAALKGKKLLDEFGEGAQGKLAQREPELAWYLIDLSGQIDNTHQNIMRVVQEKVSLVLSMMRANKEFSGGDDSDN